MVVKSMAEASKEAKQRRASMSCVEAPIAKNNTQQSSKGPSVMGWPQEITEEVDTPSLALSLFGTLSLPCLTSGILSKSFLCKSVEVKKPSGLLRPGILSWSIVPLFTSIKGSIIALSLSTASLIKLVKEVYLPFVGLLLLLSPCLDVSANICSVNFGFTRQKLMAYLSTKEFQTTSSKTTLEAPTSLTAAGFSGCKKNFCLAVISVQTIDHHLALLLIKLSVYIHHLLAFFPGKMRDQVLSCGFMAARGGRTNRGHRGRYVTVEMFEGLQEQVTQLTQLVIQVLVVLKLEVLHNSVKDPKGGKIALYIPAKFQRIQYAYANFKI
ncbi:hypothetical protein M9H77_25326 [Catharanthus roseus]|uniref:Uncharacterized protein n=1 Tax=Catharanthus roseus TaxID=4058 RepID=A0ACC0A6K6_CATRO|nr:hypothetical protein M9H77_25326 [Catharanthus roseus]